VPANAIFSDSYNVCFFKQIWSFSSSVILEAFFRTEFLSEIFYKSSFQDNRDNKESFVVKDTIDLKIWQRFKDGESQALAEIYRCYTNDLYSYGKKISKDEVLIKDSIQEIFVKLINKRSQLIISENIHTYLFKSLRNKILEELRSENRKKNILIQITPESAHVSSIEQSIVLGEEETHKQLLIDQAMNVLTDYQREAIYLRFNQMFEYEEIAEMLGIDVASARTLVYRSLKKVKEHLSVRTTILFSMIVRSKC